MTTSDLAPIDVATIPALAELAAEVARTRQPRRLRHGDRDLAVLVPIPAPVDDPLPAPVDDPPWQRAESRRRRKGSVIAATAGAVRYDGPVLTAEEERAAYEQALAADAEDLGT